MSEPDTGELAKLFLLMPRPDYMLNYRVARREGILQVILDATIDEAQQQVIEATPSYSRLEIDESLPKDPNQGTLFDS